MARQENSFVMVLVWIACLAAAGVADAATCGSTSSASIVTVKNIGTFKHVSANGCPGYASNQSTPNSINAQTLEFQFPLSPVINSKTVTVGLPTPILGPIGITTFNGVPLYSPADAMKRDALTFEGATFDTCGGHAGPMGYHYHSTPGDQYPTTHRASRNGDFKICSSIQWKDTAGQHSPILGLLADGIPIFGPRADKGLTPTDLDECNGHTDKTYSFYHYHSTSDYPYLVQCLRGCINTTNWPFFSSSENVTCTPSSKQYDYTWLANFTTSTATPSSSSPPPPPPSGARGPAQINLSFTTILLVLSLFSISLTNIILGV